MLPNGKNQDQRVKEPIWASRNQRNVCITEKENSVWGRSERSKKANNNFMSRRSNYTINMGFRQDLKKKERINYFY